MLCTPCAHISFYPVQISNILVLTVYSSSLILPFRYSLFVPIEYMSFIPDTVQIMTVITVLPWMLS